MKNNALILTGGLLNTVHAKTAHGLIRGSDRYNIVGVIDQVVAGQDAGEVLDGIHRGIPVFENISTYLAENPTKKASHCILGIASAGGRIPEEIKPIVKTCIESGIGIISGLHEFLSDDPVFSDLAKKHDVELLDVRKAKPREELHFWDGSIFEVKCPKVAVMGVDCGIGKRTSAKFIVDQLKEDGVKARMVHTGQTGTLQSGKHGFVLDSTLNDFVSGELEHAIVSCYHDEDPDIILVEGQAALRNPSGPCGSEFLVSGKMDAVILVHAPGRIYYKGWEHLGIKIPSIESEIELIKMYGVPVIGLCLNTRELSVEQAEAFQSELEARLGIPVSLPIEKGVQNLVPSLKKLIS